MTKAQIVRMLKDRQGKMSLRSLAQAIPCSPAYVSDIYLGRRAPGPKILTYLGLRKVETREVRYVRGGRKG